MRISFRFRTIPFVATVLLVALGVSLGQWQDRRAAEKTALQHKLADQQRPRLAFVLEQLDDAVELGDALFHAGRDHLRVERGRPGVVLAHVWRR